MAKAKPVSATTKKSLAKASPSPAAQAAAEASRSPASGYSGKITTSGTSEAFRFDKTLFRQHPEFKQKAEVRADVIGPGIMLVSLIDNPKMENEDDPVVSAFLS